MNVPDKLKKIRLFFDENRLESVLKEMTRALVPAIERNGIARKDSSHDAGEWFPSRTQQKVQMIRHKRPRIYRGRASREGIVETCNHVLAILLSSKQLATVYASHHYMMKGALDVESRFTWHTPSYQARWRIVNGINGTTSPDAFYIWRGICVNSLTNPSSVLSELNKHGL